MPKELLFSITAKDCRFDKFRGSGKGGQKRNKTESAVRCVHIKSNAVGKSDDTRSQHKNKIIAFRRMTETKEFKNWHRLEIARCTGRIAQAEEYVERTMRSSNLKVEGKSDDGLWEPLSDGHQQV